MKLNHPLVPLVLACALLMQQLDTTSVTTSLPQIAESLGEPTLRLHMLVTAYLLSFAAFLPMSGWVADRFGAKLVFRIAMGLFILASALCGSVQSLDMMIFFRIVQGLGGALMVPVARLILVRSVPKSELLGAMTLMGMPALVGPMLGPVLGGVLTTYASWHWIFWLNVPVGLVGIVLATKYVGDVQGERTRPFDWVGFVLCGLGLAGVLFGVDALMRRGAFSVPTVGMLLVAVAFLGAYVWHERRVKHAILDLGLLKFHSFRQSVVGGSFFRVGVGAVTFLLPLMFQQAFGYTPVQAGLMTACMAVGSLGMRSIAKHVLKRFGFKNVLVWNGVLSAAFLVVCGFFRPGWPELLMVAVIFCGGVFRSLQFTSVNALAYAEIEQKQMSHATSFAEMAQRLSISFGVALSAFVLHAAGGDAAVLPVSAFMAAFAVIGFISMLCVPVFMCLHPRAGEEIAGRKAVDNPNTVKEQL